MKFHLLLCTLWQACGLLLNYKSFKIDYDCSKRSADRFTYTLDGATEGSAKRAKNFFLDPELDAGCQQLSTKSYAHIHPGFNRGHLVKSSHMSKSQSLRKQVNYMTNIVPQADSFNGGLWLQTEDLTDCYRPQSVIVHGGVVYSNSSNDFYLQSHGIMTPDYMWKVLTFGNTVLAWYFPNENGLSSKLDDYRVSVEYIESQLNDGLGPIPIPLELKKMVASRRLIRRNNRFC